MQTSILEKQPRRSPFLRATLIVLLCLAGAAVIAVTAGFAWFWATLPDGHIFPGVTAAGLPLGGLTVNAAAQRLDQAWNRKSVVLSDGQSSWQTNPAFLGIWMDPGATLAQAPILGDRSISWNSIQTRIDPPVYALDPVVRFDRGVAESALTHWAETVNLAPQDAQLSLADGKLESKASRQGRALDVTRVVDRIASDPKAVLESGRLDVYFSPVNPEITDVSQAAAKAKGYLDLHLGGAIYDPIKDETIAWQIDPGQIASWVSVERQADRYAVHFNRTGLIAYLADLQQHVDLGPDRVIDALPEASSLADSVLAGKAPLLIARYLPTEYTLQSPETLFQVGWDQGIPYWRMMKANPAVNPKVVLPAGQKLTVPSRSDLLPVPVIPNKRIVISITHQRMQVFQDGKQIREFVISTGISDSPTQPGVFQVQTHDPNAYASNWNLWMPNWLGIYEAWPGFMNGIHGLPMLSNGVRLWANVLGKPASFGCIILSLDNAAWLYTWAENGVVVEIQA